MSNKRRWISSFAALLQEHPTRVLTRDDFEKGLLPQRAAAGVPTGLGASRLIKVLSEEAGLRQIQVHREGRTGSIDTKTRYAFGAVSAYAVGVSLVKDAYLTHASAMFLHALTDQIPRTVYVNREQSPKPRPSLPLSQPAINRAFKRAPRESTYVFTSEDARFVLLSGKNTGRLEVAPMRTPQEELVDTTKLERTLIDIVVRPVYAGGPHEVMRAYETAASRISMNTLIATLKRLDYVYPYHQAIGFLLQKVGVPEPQLAKLEALGLEWDFYLAHQISDPLYDSRWRLFYPQGL